MSDHLQRRHIRVERIRRTEDVYRSGGQEDVSNQIFSQARTVIYGKVYALQIRAPMIIGEVHVMQIRTPLIIGAVRAMQIRTPVIVGTVHSV